MRKEFTFFPLQRWFSGGSEVRPVTCCFEDQECWREQAGAQLPVPFPFYCCSLLGAECPAFSAHPSGRGTAVLPAHESRSRHGQTSGEVAQHVDDGRFGLGRTKTQEN